MSGVEARYAPELTSRNGRLVEYTSTSSGKRRLLARRLAQKPSSRSKKPPCEETQATSVVLDWTLPQGYWYCTRCRGLHDKKSKSQKAAGPKVPMFFVTNGIFDTDPEEFENGGHICDNIPQQQPKQPKQPPKAKQTPKAKKPSQTPKTTSGTRGSSHGTRLSDTTGSKASAGRKRPAAAAPTKTPDANETETDQCPPNKRVKRQYKGVQENMTKAARDQRDKPASLTIRPEDKHFDYSEISRNLIMSTMEARRLKIIEYEDNIRARREKRVLDGSLDPDPKRSTPNDGPQTIDQETATKMLDLMREMQQDLGFYEEKNRYLEGELHKTRQTVTELRELTAVHGKTIHQLVRGLNGFEGVTLKDLMPSYSATTTAPSVKPLPASTAQPAVHSTDCLDVPEPAPQPTPEPAPKPPPVSALKPTKPLPKRAPEPSPKPPSPQAPKPQAPKSPPKSAPEPVSKSAPEPPPVPVSELAPEPPPEPVSEPPPESALEPPSESALEPPSESALEPHPESAHESMVMAAVSNLVDDLLDKVSVLVPLQACNPAALQPLRIAIEWADLVANPNMELSLANDEKELEAGAFDNITDASSASFSISDASEVLSEASPPPGFVTPPTAATASTIQRILVNL